MQFKLSYNVFLCSANYSSKFSLMDTIMFCAMTFLCSQNAHGRSRSKIEVDYETQIRKFSEIAVVLIIEK